MLVILKRLLHIKEHRERKAEFAMLEAKRAHQKAIDEVENAKMELAQYELFIVREEKRLYSVLMSRKAVKVEDIEEVRDRVASLWGKKIQYEEGVKRLEKIRDEAKEELQRKKDLYTKAMKMTKKYIELVDISQKEVDWQIEQAEYNEIDEVASLAASRSMQESEE